MSRKKPADIITSGSLSCIIDLNVKKQEIQAPFMAVQYNWGLPVFDPALKDHILIPFSLLKQGESHE